MFHNLHWSCFVTVTVRVTFKSIQMKRFRPIVYNDLRNIVVTDKSDSRTVRWCGSEYWSIRRRGSWTFHAAIWRRNPDPSSRLCLLAQSWRKSACCVLRRLASNCSLPHLSIKFYPFFHGDFRLFWNNLCCQRGHESRGPEWHTSLRSLRNKVVRRRMCEITDFPLRTPFKGLLWNSSKVQSILKYIKCPMFENSGFMALVFSMRQLIPLKRS